jgi:general secretion pathway protein D
VLKDGYEQGIDWTQLSSGGVVRILSRQINGTANLSYDKANNPSALISLLETFGTTKVLSSPRLSVLNNQTALLKVVENVVFFNVKSDIAGATTNAGALKSFTTTPQTVSVGLVLTVTPQISDNNQIVLNVRPSISSIASFVRDPNPDLTIPNQIPQIRTREIESIMRVSSGEIAILGGLMEDKIDYQNQRIPVVGQIPIAGELVNNRNNSARKSELVIFLRPVVIKDASLNGDYSNYRSQLPGEDFFKQSPEAQPFNNFPSR